MSMSRRVAGGGLAAMLSGALVCAALVPDALAGPGHDHGAAPRAIVVSPRAEVRIGNQEAVLVNTHGRMIVALHRYADGRPTVGAELEATVGFLPSSLQEVAPGIYESQDIELAAGRNDIELAYTIEGRSGSVVVPLVMPSTGTYRTASAVTNTASAALPGFVLALTAAAIFLAANLLLGARPQRA